MKARALLLLCYDTDERLQNNGQYLYLWNQNFSHIRGEKHPQMRKKFGEVQIKRYMYADKRRLANYQDNLFTGFPKAREDKGDREGIPHTHPIPWVIRLELFLESG